MAIFHLSVKAISRRDGRSATAAAAYRSAVRIEDERTGEVFDFRKKGGVVHSEIVLPAGAPIEFQDRSCLWNRAEQMERRRDAKVAREVEVGLPHELPRVEQIALAVDFAKSISRDFDVAVDVAIHAPEASWSDRRNVHAHLLISTRVVDTEKGFGAKTRELDVSKSASEIVERWREAWSEKVNRALQGFGIEETVDHRSYERQGVLKVPQPKLGPRVLSLEREGVLTERGAAWRQWHKQQQEMEELEMELQKMTQQTDAKDSGDKEAEEALARFSGVVLAENNRKVRQDAKLRILEEQYRRKILNYDFVNDLKYVKKGKSRLEIKVKSGGQLIDLGDRVVADRMDDKKAAEHMATLAEAKGWERVSLTGSEAFKAQAWLELKKRGMEVVDYDPPQEIREQWEAFQQEGHVAPVPEPEPHLAEEVADWKRQRQPEPEPETGEKKRRRMRP
jgi:hypothetical protein